MAAVFPFKRLAGLLGAGFALLFFTLPTAANDAVAGLDAGELVLLESDAVEMLEEELYLSPSEVRVRYLFRNISDVPVTTLVAFPLPPIVFDFDSNYGFGPGNTDPVDVVGFKVWIDGQEVAVSIDASATGQDGRDVTALLEKWRIPLTFLTPDQASFERLWRHLDALPKAALAELSAAGAIEDYELGLDFSAAWTTHIRYYWSMTFAPGRSVEVRHRYAPVTNAFIFTEMDLEMAGLRDEVCMDSGFTKAVQRRLAASESGASTAEVLRYILTTAGSWRGPIGWFHLTIDKEDPQALVSLCRQGIRKTGPTTFEWEARDWTPESNLSVMFMPPNL